MIDVNGNVFRRRRFRRFLDLLDQSNLGDRRVRILDVGGTHRFWRTFEPQFRDRQLDITIVNLGVPDCELADNMRIRAGDARALDYADNSFDIVHSNSTIEHLGGWTHMAHMAREVRRVAPHYFIQTPNYWFPIEPHYRRPFMHWYPESTRAAMILRRKRGFLGASDFDEAMEIVQSLSLLTARQMMALFPDGRLIRERFGPFTKSLLAVR